jgi:hypothetical protein
MLCLDAHWWSSWDLCALRWGWIVEGIRKGNRYEELLKKMEDMKYWDRWLSGSEKGDDTSMQRKIDDLG